MENMGQYLVLYKMLPPCARKDCNILTYFVAFTAHNYLLCGLRNL
jgi:hypothetical protein